MRRQYGRGFGLRQGDVVVVGAAVDHRDSRVLREHRRLRIEPLLVVGSVGHPAHDRHLTLAVEELSEPLCRDGALFSEIVAHPGEARLGGGGVEHDQRDPHLCGACQRGHIRHSFHWIDGDSLGGICQQRRHHFLLGGSTGLMGGCELDDYGP